MQYTAKYFRDNHPAWKAKKSALFVRLIYRPLSFYLTNFAVKLQLTANFISYFSTIVAIAACGLFLVNSQTAHIIGAVLVNLWLLLDCVDGNIARNVKRQPFGDFADSMSSYILVGLVCTSMGVSVYWTGGLFVKPNQAWIIVLGAFASNADTLMRLLYQKYRSVSRELQELSIIPTEYDIRDDNNAVGDIRIRIEKEFGIAGLLPFAILIAALFNTLDLIVFYCFFYYGGSCVVSTFMLFCKANKYAKAYEFPVEKK